MASSTAPLAVCSSPACGLAKGSAKSRAKASTAPGLWNGSGRLLLSSTAPRSRVVRRTSPAVRFDVQDKEAQHEAVSLLASAQRRAVAEKEQEEAAIDPAEDTVSPALGEAGILMQSDSQEQIPSTQSALGIAAEQVSGGEVAEFAPQQKELEIVVTAPPPPQDGVARLTTEEGAEAAVPSADTSSEEKAIEPDVASPENLGSPVEGTASVQSVEKQEEAAAPEQEEFVDPCKIFVYGIPFEVRGRQLRESLQELFGRYGQVKDLQIAPLVRDGKTIRSRHRGFAFVVMESAEAATEAIEQLGGKTNLGATLMMRLAVQKSSTTPRS